MASRLEQIAEWLLKCPQIQQLYGISAEEVDNTNLIMPKSSSERRYFSDSIDEYGEYFATVTPTPSYSEEYQINLFKRYYPDDNATNYMAADDVYKVLKWVIDQDESGNFPNISGETVIAVEPYPNIPTIRYINETNNLVAYYFTLKIRYINKAKRIEIVNGNRVTYD